MTLGLGVHSGPGVAHRQQHVRAGPRAGVAPCEGLIQIDVRRSQGELAALGHGVAGVDHQVHDDLLDLSRVGLDPAERLPLHGGHLDVLSDHAAEHLVEVREEGVEIQHPGLDHLLPAEREELARQGGGALGRLLDLIDLGAHRVALGQALGDQLPVPGDDVQQIIEVVGDPARQPADGFHLLRLPKLLLELLALRDVVHGDHRAEVPAVPVQDRLTARDDRARQAVRGNDGQLGVADLLALQRPEERNRLFLQGSLPVRVEQAVVFGPSLRRQGFLRKAVELPRGAVEQRQDAVPVAGHDANLEALEQRPEELSFVLQRLLDLPSRAAAVGFAHGPAHRGAETRETVLEDVVRGPAVEALDGRFFAEGPRHDDERKIGCPGPDNLQGGEAIEGRKREIGQDEVGVSSLEGGDEGRAVRDDLDVAVDAALFQSGPYELHVVRVIFEVQDAQRSLHVRLGPKPFKINAL